MKAFKRHRPDYCPICNQDRALELFDMGNHPVRLTAMIDMKRLDNLTNRKLKNFRCRLCKKEFEIDWMVDYNIPYPLDEKIKQEILKNNLNNI